MPSLRQQLESLRNEALGFFAHPEDRGRGEATRDSLASVMAEVHSLIQGSGFSVATTLSSLHLHTRQMSSALSLRYYERWDEQAEWDEDILIWKRGAGESDARQVGAEEARQIFLDALDRTMELLILAEPLSIGRESASVSRSGPQPETEPNAGALTWEQVEISLLSDHRVQIKAGDRTYSMNYAEMGFADDRSKNANKAWLMLLALARQRGVIRTGAEADGQPWPKVERRMQEIRKVLRQHFRISADPLPFTPGTGYQTRFRIGVSPSFET